LKSVNGLWGLAILAILFDHVTHDLVPAFGPGWTGIDLLFILSGFVMFEPYAADREAMASRGSVWAFYQRGFMAVMPLYYVTMVVELVVAPKPWSQAAWLLCGLFDFYPSLTQGLSNWALYLVGVAIVYGITFPGMVWLWWRVGPGRLVPIVILAALAARIIESSALGFPGVSLLMGTQLGAPYAALGMIAHLDEFVLGMLVAHMQASGAINRPYPNLIWPGLALVTAACIGFDIVGFGRLEVLRAFMIDLLEMGYVLLVVAALSPAGLFSRFLSWRPLQVCGVLSYSIYIWHVPILHVLNPSRKGNVAFLSGSLVYIFAVFVVAAVSYRFIELPMASIGRRALSSPNRASAASRPEGKGAGARYKTSPGDAMTRQVERWFIFVFRMLAAWMFLFAAKDQLLMPDFTTHELIPLLSKARVFHDVFAIFATPALAPVIGVLVPYGHLLIGLSLLFGCFVRISASVGVALMVMYWLLQIGPPDVTAANFSGLASSVHAAYRMVEYVIGLALDGHVLYSVVLAYLVASRAGHAWGLDAWIAKLPLLARYPGLRRLRAFVG
jgi:peptidoglycan/LPS O-acetylase OafA/YrhL